MQLSPNLQLCDINSCFSAREKLDEDLCTLERQIRLQAGEEVTDTEERPAEVYLKTPMVCDWVLTRNSFCSL